MNADQLSREVAIKLLIEEVNNSDCPEEFIPTILGEFEKHVDNGETINMAFAMAKTMVTPDNDIDYDEMCAYV